MGIAGHVVEIVVSALLTTFAACGFYLIFRASQGASRSHARRVSQVFDLKPGAVSQELSWKLTGTPHEVEIINGLVVALTQAGAEVVRHDADQIVAYFGSRAKAKMNGFMHGDPVSMPTRLILKSRELQGTIWLQSRLDDDYGLQFFLGATRNQFQRRYGEAFAQIVQVLMPHLHAYNPSPVQIIAGAT